ncbi:hypothetical protein MT350_19510 [Rathayibacter sp. VKM Ac-2928]|nr:hypothetical protein [Rathayibacter sp. VKM Ac-2928]
MPAPSVLGLESQRECERFCGICGVWALSTRAHVPPRAAGNGTNVKRLVFRTVDGRVLPAGRPLEGGMWVRGLCSRCNSDAGSRFDEAYADFARSVIRYGSTFAPLAQLSAVPPVRLAPGPVSRSILHGMHALNPTLRLLFPELATALRAGGPVRLPAQTKLRVAAYGFSRARLSGSIHSRRVLQEAAVHLSFADVVFPPFIWSLVVAEEGQATDDWADASEWPLYGPDAVVGLRLLTHRFPLANYPLDVLPNSWIQMHSDEAAVILEGNVQRSDLLR